MISSGQSDPNPLDPFSRAHGLWVDPRITNLQHLQSAYQKAWKQGGKQPPSIMTAKEAPLLSGDRVLVKSQKARS